MEPNSRNIRNLLDNGFLLSSRIAPARFGLARIPYRSLGNSARFKIAAPSATERMALLAKEWPICMRTRKERFGPRDLPDCGGGSRVRRNSFPYLANGS